MKETSERVKAMEERVSCTEMKKTLEEMEDTIRSLRHTITEMQRQIAAQKAENYRLRNREPPIQKRRPQTTLPFELVTMIFFECDAKTRCRLTCMSKRTVQELGEWSDVQHIYVARAPTFEDDEKTVITHKYEVITNSKSVGKFRVARMIPMLCALRNLKTVLVESSTEPYLRLCNRIPVDEGFFSLLHNLEVAKLCCIRTNLSIPYTLNDFLGLKNMKVLHIREVDIPLDALELGSVRAPIEDLRICTQKITAKSIINLCMALSKTLRRLELLINLIIPELNTTPNNRRNTTMNIIRAMAQIENLTHVTLPRALLMPSIINDVFNGLRSFQTLKEITFETFALPNLHRLINNFLPLQCDCMVITDNIRIDELWYSVTSATNEFFGVFNDNRISVLREECEKAVRPFTVQFGRTRNVNPKAVFLRMGLVNIVGKEVASPPPRNKNNCRVFLWKGRILSRSEYLMKYDIDINSSSP